MHTKTHIRWDKALAFIALLWMGNMVVCGQAKVDTNDYLRQYVSLNKAYAENPEDVVNLIAMATFYAQPDNPQYNLPQADVYIRQAEKLFIQLVEDRSQYKAVMKLIKQKISINSIRQQRQQIESSALEYLTQRGQHIDATVLATYAEIFAYNKEISVITNRMLQYEEYRKTCRLNTLDAYYHFIQQHQGTLLADSAEDRLKSVAAYCFSELTDEDSIIQIAERFTKSAVIQQAAMVQRSRIAYLNACKINTIASYSHYLERFPQGENYIDVLERLESLRTIEFGMLSTPSDYTHYAVTNSELPLADTAIDRLRSMIKEERRTDAVELYLNNFPLDDRYNEIFREYYQWVSAEGNRQPIAAFAEHYPNYPYRVALSDDLARAEGIDSLDLTLRYTESDFAHLSAALHQFTGKKIAFVVLQRLLQLHIANQEWKAAQERMHGFDICFEDCSQAEYAELDALLASGNSPAIVQEMTADAMEHVIVHPSGRYAYFTHNENGVYSIGYALPEKSKESRWKYEGNVTVEGCPGQPIAYNFYDKGQHVLVGIAGDIYTAAVVDSSLWRIEERLPAPINSEWFEGDAFITEDGSAILLVSDRPGGHNYQKSSTYYHGDYARATDIYCIPHTPAGWGEAVNLGCQVNTPYCERSPLLSRNMKTLYYVTDGHGGLGYGDIYRVTRKDVTDWTHWSKPVNLGKNANGCFDESSIAFGQSERRLFITSNSPKGGYNRCYSMTTSHDTNVNNHTVCIDISAVNSHLSRIDVADPIGQYVKTSWTGKNIQPKIYHPLALGQQYVIIPRADSLYIPEVLFRMTKGTDTIVIRGYTLQQLINLKEPIPIRTIHYAGGELNLPHLSEYGMRNLGLFLLRNPQCNVEIIVQADGHDAEACYNLSTQRAISLRSLMVDMGISINRIKLTSYGNLNYKKGKKPPEVSVRFF